MYLKNLSKTFKEKNMASIIKLKQLYGFFVGVLFFMLLFFVSNNSFAQIDTSEYYDDESDLFDSTANYREMYKDLDKDGEWIQTTKGELEDMIPKDDEEIAKSGDNCCRDQIIWVWRPRVYYVGWTPYCNGRWYYTVWGWFWYSFYDWGWACYHHGRWVFSPIYGWIWIPGRVWAPAWVDWCYTGAYVGWFPRFPRFHRWHKHRYHYHHHHYYNYWTFIEKKKFAKELITKENVIDADYNQLLISKSNIAKNSKYNDIIINQGPPVKNIEKSTNEKIKPIEVKYSEKEKTVKIDDNSITIYKPKESIVKETGNKNTNSTTQNKEKKKDNINRDTESKKVDPPKKEKNYDGYENKERENNSYENRQKETDPNKYEREESKSNESKKERENKSYESKQRENKSYENKERETKPRDVNKNYNSGERKSKENNSGNNNNGNRNNNSNRSNESNTNNKRE